MQTIQISFNGAKVVEPVSLINLRFPATNAAILCDCKNANILYNKETKNNFKKANFLFVDQEIQWVLEATLLCLPERCPLQKPKKIKLTFLLKKHVLLAVRRS